MGNGFESGKSMPRAQDAGAHIEAPAQGEKPQVPERDSRSELRELIAAFTSPRAPQEHKPVAGVDFIAGESRSYKSEK